MKKDILVSIECMAYNHEKYISKALESFIMQKTNFNFEIIVHDDASTDKTAAIIEEYRKKYPNIIKPIYQKENQYSKGKKIGTILLEKMQGKYIAFCEGDDYWTDQYKLQKQIDYMEKNPECGMCFHTVEILDDNSGEIIGKIKPYNRNRIASTEDIIMGDGGFIGTNSLVYKTESMRKELKFYLECQVEDYPIQIYNSTQKYAYFMEEEMSVYRVNTGISWTDRNGNFKKQKDFRMNLIKMLREFDHYTDHRYERVIKKRINKWSYKILKYNQRYHFLNNDEYKEYYKNIFFSRKMELFLRKLFKYKI